MRSMIVFVVLLAACGGGGNGFFSDAGNGDGGTGDGGSGVPEFTRRIPTVLNRDVDLVFLVDNSGSMLVEQQQLTANFPQFINVLQTISGGLPNVHIGVLSSNVGAAGASSVPGCAAAGDDGNLLTGPPGNTCATQYGLQGTFISDIAQSNGTRQRNYTGQLDQLFTCMASLGTSGCGFEMHLESVFRALQPGKNAGFLRAGAHLAIVILADEDDCSTEMGVMFGDPNAGISSQLGPRTSFRCHEFGVTCNNDPNPRTFGPKTGCRPNVASQYMYEVQRYVDFLRNLKTGNARVMVAGILGNFDPASGDLTVGPDPNNAMFPAVQKSCFTRDPNDPNDGAAPAVRLRAFLSAFPDRNTVTTICNDNLADALVGVGQQLKTLVGNPCIDAQLLDVDPNGPGLQPSCVVSDVFDPDGPNRSETVLPACIPSVQSGASCQPGAAGTPCWCLINDAQSCPASAVNPSSLALSVNRAGVPASGTVTELRCRI